MRTKISYEQIDSGVLDATRFGMEVDETASNTAANTAALNTLLADINAKNPNEGPLIKIPRYCTFFLDQITFGKRQTLEYYIDDDKSETVSGTRGVSEKITLPVNASDFGISNEEILTATFHPGHVVDVRKDVDGHDAYLYGDQDRLQPARASYNIRDEQLTMFRTVYENWALDDNLFSGVRLEGFRYLLHIDGIGSDSFTTPPVKGDRIGGIDSGALGILYSITPTSMELIWSYKEFQVGERVNDGNETTTDVITDYRVGAFTGDPYSLQALRCGRNEGNWTLGLPANNEKLSPYLWGVGGKSIATIPRSMSQVIPSGTSLTETGYAWADNMELATPNGYEIVYDTTPAATSRRLELKKLGESAPISAIGLHKASTLITSTLNPSASSLNVSTPITNPSTGVYTITFTNEITRGDYRTQTSIRKLTAGMHDLRVQEFAKTTTSVTLHVYTASTGALTNLDANHQINLDVFGGDI